ncbi:MAG: M20/M25/M40 family metallo-hydrolase [Halobacteriales archaeon]|nr:M20/M25/M40 family metallo-hydrolase [Halobacteriales archaeon]
MSNAPPPDLETAATDLIDRREEWLGILTELLAIPSPNPPGDTTEIAEYLLELFDDRGIETTVIAPKTDMPNVIAQFEGTQGDGPHLGFNGHLDTFPVPEPDAWEYDPFGGTIDNGRVYGRGAVDMHGGFTASLAAFLYLHEHRDRLPGRVTLSVTSDEETGSEWGAEYVLDNHPEYRSDALINGEPSGPNIVRFAGRGAVWLELSVRGEGAHSSYPAGVNAIDVLTELVETFRARLSDLVDIPEQAREAIVAGREQMDTAFGDGATDLLLDAQVNLTTIEGGEKVNLTPARASAELDIRLPLGTDGTAAIELLESLAAEQPGEIEIDVFHHTDPNHSDLTHPIFDAVRRHAARNGPKPALSCGLAMTDARFFRQHGVPAAVYGPTPNRVGAPDEFITIEEFDRVLLAHGLGGLAFLTDSTE